MAGAGEKAPRGEPRDEPGREIDQMKDLVVYIAKNLVDRPDEVEVQDVEEDGGVVLELIVAEEDLGKVIGRQGRTARAIRTVLGAAVQKSASGRRISLEILE